MDSAVPDDEPIDHLAPAPPAAPPRPGVLAGLGALFGGIGFLLRRPQSWPLAAVPAILLVTVAASLAAVACYWIPDVIELLIGPPEGTWGTIGAGVLKALATMTAMVLSGVIGFSLAQPLSGPALEGIIRLQEAELGAPERPPSGFVVDMLRSAQSLLVGYGLGLPALAVLFVVSLLFSPAVVVTTPLKVIVLALMVAWDLCDYPLTVRGLPVGQRVRIVARHWRATLGFGIALTLASLVPCLLFFCLPAGVAGAGRLMWRVEQWEQAQRR